MESEFFDSLISTISKDNNFQIFNNLNIDETELLASGNASPGFDELPESETIKIPDKGEDNEDLHCLDSSDFMFSNGSDWNEDILPEQCFDSILDSITFYNKETEKEIQCDSDITFNYNKEFKETERGMSSINDITLNYNKDKEETEKEISCDSIISVNEPESVNLETDAKSVNLVPDPAFNCDIVYNPDYGFTTENLENIVPNCNAYTNNDVNDSFNSTPVYKFSESELLNQSFNSYFNKLIVDKETEPNILNKLTKSPRLDSLSELGNDKPIIINKSFKCQRVAFSNDVNADIQIEPIVETQVKSPVIDFCNELTADKEPDPCIVDNLVENLWIDYFSGLSEDEVSETSIVDKLIESLRIDHFNELTADIEKEIVIVDVPSPRTDYSSELTGDVELFKSPIADLNELNRDEELFKSPMLDYLNDFTSDEDSVESPENDYLNGLTGNEELFTSPSSDNLIGVADDEELLKNPILDFLIEVTADKETEHFFVDSPVQASKIDFSNELIDDNESEQSIVDKLFDSSIIKSSSVVSAEVSTEPIVINKPTDYSSIACLREFSADRKLEPIIGDILDQSLGINNFTQFYADKEAESILADTLIKSPQNNLLNELSSDKETEPVNSQIIDYLNGIIVNKETERIIEDPPVLSSKHDIFSGLCAGSKAEPLGDQVGGSSINLFAGFTADKETESVIKGKSIKNQRINIYSELTPNSEPVIMNEPVGSPMIDYLSGIDIDKEIEPVTVNRTVTTPMVDYLSGLIVDRKTDVVAKPAENAIIDLTEDKNTEPIKIPIVDYLCGITVDKDTEPIIVSKRNKCRRIDSDSEDINNHLFNSKNTLSVENNNNVELNNNIVVNNESDSSVATSINLPTLQLKKAKLLDSHAVSFMSGKCFSTVPVKKLKDANGLPSVMLYVKKSQVDGLRKQSILLNGGQVDSLTKPKECVLKNVTESCTVNDTVQVAQGITSVQSTDSSHGLINPVKRNNDINNYKIVDNTNINVLQKRRLENTQNLIDLPDKIRKPEVTNDSLWFTFSVFSRKMFGGTLNFDTFQKDNEIIKYYTGIPKYSYFMALLHCLKLPVNNVVSPFQMLLLTLMKLRLNLEWMDLAYRFGKTVTIVQETFGVTLYILVKCLSQLVGFSFKEKRENYRVRKRATLFVYSIKANLAKEEDLKRIFICLSSNNHPIHFVSKAVLDNECTNGLDILASSGIMDKLVVRDLIVFDKEIDYLPAEEGRSALSVLSDDHDSFCTQPFVNDQNNKLGRMEETVSEIKQYKFLYGTIKCGWADDQCNNKLNLFNNAVTVVCSIVNLCSILPFTKNSVTSIMSERNTMNILIT